MAQYLERPETAGNGPFGVLSLYTIRLSDDRANPAVEYREVSGARGLSSVIPGEVGFHVRTEFRNRWLLPSYVNRSSDRPSISRIAVQRVIAQIFVRMTTFGGHDAASAERRLQRNQTGGLEPTWQGMDTCPSEHVSELRMRHFVQELNPAGAGRTARLRIRRMVRMVGPDDDQRSSRSLERPDQSELVFVGIDPTD